MKQLQSVMSSHVKPEGAAAAAAESAAGKTQVQLPASNEFDDTQTHEILPLLFLGGIYSATKAGNASARLLSLTSTLRNHIPSLCRRVGETGHLCHRQLLCGSAAVLSRALHVQASEAAGRPEV